MSFSDGMHHHIKQQDQLEINYWGSHYRVVTAKCPHPTVSEPPHCGPHSQKIQLMQHQSQKTVKATRCINVRYRTKQEQGHVD